MRQRRTKSAATTNHRSQNKHANLQPPALDLRAIWRPLSNDLVNHMQKLQKLTLRILSEKIDQLVVGNEQLRSKLSSINTMRYTHQLTTTNNELLNAITPRQPQPPTWLEYKDDDPNKEEDDAMSFDDEVATPTTEPLIRRVYHKSGPSNEVNRITSPNLRQQEALPLEEARHFHWMKKRFTECFGLPTDMYKRRNLISFEVVLIWHR